MKLFELYHNIDLQSNHPNEGDDGETELGSSLISRDSLAAELNSKIGRPRGENMKKARQIANAVKAHKRESNAKDSETPFQSNLGGHGSAFLNR